MLKNGGLQTDWTLEEYRLLESVISKQETLRTGLRRWALVLVTLVAALRYPLARLSAGEAFRGVELLGLGVLLILGFWLVELIHYVSQDRAEHRVRALERALAPAAPWIGHDLRARPGAPARARPSPRLGHVMQGEARGFWSGLWGGVRNPRILGFYLVVLAAFAAWHQVTAHAQPLVSSAPTAAARLDEIAATLAELPGRLDRIATGMDALPDRIAGSLPEPTVSVELHAPDLAPLLGPLDQVRTGLAAIETALREFEPVSLTAPAPPAPAAECEGRAWGIGSSSVSCAPARP